MSYVDTAGTDEVPPDTMKAAVAGGREVVLVNHEGAYHALPRYCPHMGGDLADGTLTGGTITCPRHGSVFDVTTGRALEGPHIIFLHLKPKDTVTYQVRVEDDRILVDTGD